MVSQVIATTLSDGSIAYSVRITLRESIVSHADIVCIDAAAAYELSARITVAAIDCYAV